MTTTVRATIEGLGHRLPRDERGCGRNTTNTLDTAPRSGFVAVKRDGDAVLLYGQDDEGSPDYSVTTTFARAYQLAPELTDEIQELEAEWEDEVAEAVAIRAADEADYLRALGSF